MFAHVTGLRYWKSERADITTCEDALGADIPRGLFCIADGAGTTLFSNIWADILVRQFVQNPLTSNDPFEMEWWIRQAQKSYQGSVPSVDTLGWNARQKAVEQGAYATLATLSFTAMESQSAKAQFLVVGDSCGIIGRPTGQKLCIEPFPLQHANDFNRAPYCVPALQRNLNRYMLYPGKMDMTLVSGDIVILATDAVARWIISGKGSGDESLAGEAFLEVANKTESDWPAFIKECRDNQTMVDDDSTAIIIRLQETGSIEEKLGAQASPALPVIIQRVEEFKRARAENNRELLAILYGDGSMLNAASISLSNKEKDEARAVADAMRDVLNAMRTAINTPNFANVVGPVWRRYVGLLMDEPCAETLRKNLVAQGVQLRPSLHPPASLESGSTLILTPSMLPAQGQADLVRLREAFDQHNDVAILAAADTLESSQSKNLLNENEKLWIQGARERQATLKQIQNALDKGTAQEKVDAYLPFSQHQEWLNEADLRQLALAQEFVNALAIGTTAAICNAYNDIETSPFRKHFLFSEMDLYRIREAQEEQTAIKWFRMALENGASLSLAITLSRKLRSPYKDLSADEILCLSRVEQFLQTNQSLWQAGHQKNEDLVQLANLYDRLYYSPYHFVFTEVEMQQIRRAQELVVPFTPTVMIVNGVQVNVAQFLSLYHLKPLYLSYLQKGPVEAYQSPGSILNDLIMQKLLEFEINKDITSGNTRHVSFSLEKKPKKIAEWLAGEVHTYAEGIHSVRDLPSVNVLSDILMPYALYRVYTRYLEETNAEQTITDRLNELRLSTTVVYYESFEANAPATTIQENCWLFKWWFIRQSYAALPQNGGV